MTQLEIQSTLKEHSKSIASIRQEQAEHYRILTSIDKRLSPEFFDDFQKIYDFIFIGNGKSSLKAWREEVDRERSKSNTWESRVWDIAKGIMLIIAGAMIGRYF